MTDRIPVVITGGGAVGLYLALALHREGIPCRVIEQRSTINPHSRSLGIHPVSLELFERLHIALRLVDEGLRIKSGHAFIGRKEVGEVRFDRCPPPWQFILALPQHRTESILEEELKRRAPETLIRGFRVIDAESRGSDVRLRLQSNSGIEEISTSWLIGCDGKESTVRKLADIPFPGKRYPDSYLMGDSVDTTRFGSDAAVWIHPDGLVESFPLPGGRRRWVVKTDQYENPPSSTTLKRLVHHRTGTDLSGSMMDMVTSFTAHFRLADRLHSGRLILAGDAAHVVSPIGGQGMNLGWIGADRLAVSLRRVVNGEMNATESLQNYSDEMRQVARQVARRAELNMRLGRKQHWPLAREWIVRTLISTPLNPLMANLFTMRGLGRWII